MKTNLKKYLSIVFALLMLVSVAPMGSFAAADVATIGETGYDSLQAAVEAVKSGETIVLLGSVDETVEIFQKNIKFTVDGNGNAVNGQLVIYGNGNNKSGVTFKNLTVNATEGKTCCVNVPSKTINGVKYRYSYNVAFENCKFYDAFTADYTSVISNGTGGQHNWTFDGCYIDASLFSLAQAKGVTNFTVKNTEINSENGISITGSPNTLVIENCDINCADGYGVRVQGTKSYNNSVTITGTEIDANYGVLVYNVTGANSVKINIDETCTLNNKTADIYICGTKINEAPKADITINAPEATKIVKAGAVAAIGDTVYSSIKAAVAAAEDGDVITVLADHEIANSDAEIADYDQYAYISVTDKKVTIDLNGKAVTVNPVLDKDMLAVFFADGTGDLTLTDSSEAQTGSVTVTMGEGTQAYSMFTADGETSKLTIESGNYTIDKVETGYSMIYAAQTGTGYVSGGNFVLGNAGEILRFGVPTPWMFNAVGNGVNFIEVSGGTYNADPTHRWGEVIFTEGYKVIENEDGTYSVVTAIAAIGDKAYSSIKEAVAAAEDGDVITVLADHEIANSDAEIAAYDMYAYISVTDKKVTIDLNGKAVTVNPAFDKNMLAVFFADGTGDLTLTDSSEAQTGFVTVTMGEGTQAYSMFTADNENSKLTIESGNYTIDKVEAGYSMFYAALTGTGFVSGGTFVLGNANQMTKDGVPTPWIFNAYRNGINFIEVTGGAYNADPTHRWNEAKFPKGCVAFKDADGMWKIKRGPAVVEQPTDITVGYGKMAKFAPEIRGEGLTYTWYYKDVNDSVFRKSSLKTATYDIKGLVERDGRQIYCVAKDAYGKKVTTEVVTLTVVPNEDLAIVSQPTVVEGALDKTVSVALDATGDALTYEWFFRDKGAKNFQKSSIKTATYDITLTKARMGREVYCVITDAFGDKVTSEVITINAVKTVPLKASALSYDSVAVGETVTVKMDAEGEYLTYTWYFRDANSTKYTKSSIKDSEYSITLTKARVGRTVYCVVTDAFGDSVQTEPIVIR